MRHTFSQWNRPTSRKARKPVGPQANASSNVAKEQRKDGYPLLLSRIRLAKENAQVERPPTTIATANAK